VNLMFYVALAMILFAIGGAAGRPPPPPTPPPHTPPPPPPPAPLALVTFSRMWGNVEGQVVSFFVMVVAAAEVVVGLAVVVAVFRTHRSASLDGANQLKH